MTSILYKRDDETIIDRRNSQKDLSSPKILRDYFTFVRFKYLMAQLPLFLLLCHYSDICCVIESWSLYQIQTVVLYNLKNFVNEKNVSRGSHSFHGRSVLLISARDLIGALIKQQPIWIPANSTAKPIDDDIEMIYSSFIFSSVKCRKGITSYATFRDANPQVTGMMMQYIRVLYNR